MRFSPFRYDEIRVEPASVAGSNAVRPDLDEGGYSDGGSAARYMTNLRFPGVVIDGGTRILGVVEVVLMMSVHLKLGPELDNCQRRTAE
jgi:hypothetical protein